MKPGIPWWAENYMYAAGPGMGNPTKAPPAAGQIGDGYQPHAAVSPQIWNHWRWMAAQHLGGLASLRISNWKDANTAGFVASVGVGDIMYEPVVRAYLRDFAPIAGPPLPEEFASYNGGHRWGPIAAVPVGVNYDITPNQGCHSARNGVSDRTIVNHLPNPNHAICHSVGMGVWDMTWGGAPGGIPIPIGPPGTWALVEHDHAGGLWVIGNTNPAGGGPGNEMAVSPGPGPAAVNDWAMPNTIPGFIAGTGVKILEHTHHDVGLVHPSDPGNMRWLALTDTERSTSLDGDNWTAAAFHGFGAGVTPVCFDYSAFGTKWAGFIANPANTWLIFSDDNFSSWYPPVPAPLGNAFCPIQGNIVNPTNIRIATDGFGDWVVVLVDNTAIPVHDQFEVHVSWDNGMTWTRVFTLDQPSVSANSSVDLCYGGGRFVIYLDDPTGPSQQVFLSLRGDG